MYFLIPFILVFPFLRKADSIYFWAVYTLSVFSVFYLGGSRGVLWPLLVASTFLYGLAVVFWRFGYIIASVGLAVDAIAYISEYGPAGLGAMYFAYIALYMWAVWRFGGSEFARLAGSLALIIQSVVNAFGVLRLYGSWPYAPLLAMSFLPLLLMRNNSRGRGAFFLFLGLCGLGWGLFKLFVGSLDEFAGAWVWLAYFLAAVLLASSFYLWPRGAAGGALIALGIYILSIYFAPSWMRDVIIPVVALLTIYISASLRRPIYLWPAAVAALTFLVFYYSLPAMYTPPLNISTAIGPLPVRPDGTFGPGGKNFANVTGGKFSVEGYQGIGQAEILARVLANYKFSVAFKVDFNSMEATSAETYLLYPPHLAYISVKPLDDIFWSYLACRWGESLGVGCSGLYLSFEVSAFVMGNVLIVAAAWLGVLLSPLLVYIFYNKFYNYIKR